MTDTASASLPDVEGLQAPPQAPPGELPDVDSLSDAPAPQPGFGGAVVQPGFRGARGGIPNIPDAAAARFRESDSVANIFKAAGTKYASNVIAGFSDLADQDKATLVENGYGNYTGAGGGLLQHAADAFNSGVAIIKDGFMAGVGAIPAAGGAALGQFARETGQPEHVALSAEREGQQLTEAFLADVGDQAAFSAMGPAREMAGEAATAESAAKAAADSAAQIHTAKTQASAPGIWGNAYRVDQTEGGGLTRVPLGRLPDAGAEAVAQSKTAADALHLGPDTATLIHQTYLDTGRPPAETLMDAKTNAGGVLDDLVAGKVPTAYIGPARSMTPEELAAAKPVVSPEGAAPGPLGGDNSVGSAPTAAPSAPTPETGISKIGQSIEAKAVEAKLTQGFSGTAGYDKITIADQAAKATDLVNNSLDDARAVIRGEQPLPSGLKGTALITAMEDYIKKNPDADMAYELANSPLVSHTSEAAQEMRLAAEREPDSAAAKIQELRDAQQKVAGGPKQIAARRAAVKHALPEARGVLLPKESLSWDNFLESIKC